MRHIAQMWLQSVTSDRFIDCRLVSVLDSLHHCRYRVDRSVSNLAHHDIDRLSRRDVVDECEGVHLYACQLRAELWELLRKYFIPRKPVDIDFADKSGQRA
jgi:hypothetical protein